MRTISTLLASFLTTSVFAAGFKPTASLTVRSAEKSPIVVIVDGKCFDIGSNSIMIADLEPAYHEVKVYQQTINGSVELSGKDCDVLFNSSVLLKPRTTLMIAIDDCGAITMNETKAKKPDFGDTWNGGNYNDRPGNNIYSKAISNNEFERVLWAINKESIETNKMTSAEQVITTNYFTTEQVKQLLRLFSFESNKLQLAKLCYDRVVDQSNYSTLSNLFSYNSSKDELAQCIHK
jgi:hypothetical protein